MAMGGSNDYTNTGVPASAGGLDTQHAAAMIVFVALGFLIMIRRGFRGAGIPGVGHISVN